MIQHCFCNLCQPFSNVLPSLSHLSQERQAGWGKQSADCIITVQRSWCHTGGFCLSSNMFLLLSSLKRRLSLLDAWHVGIRHSFHLALASTISRSLFQHWYIVCLKLLRRYHGLVTLFFLPPSLGSPLFLLETFFVLIFLSFSLHLSSWLFLEWKHWAIIEHVYEFNNLRIQVSVFCPERKTAQHLIHKRKHLWTGQVGIPNVNDWERETGWNADAQTKTERIMRVCLHTHYSSVRRVGVKPTTELCTIICEISRASI